MTGPDRFLDAKLGLAMLTGLVLPSPHAPDDYTALNLSSPTGLSNIISDPTWAGKPISKEELFTPVVKNGTVELPIADIQDATKFSPIWDLKGAAWAKSPDKIIGSLFASVRGLKTPLLTANNTTSGTEPATAATKYFVITPDMQNLKFGLAGSGITNAHASLAIDGQMMNRDGAASVNAVSNISWDLSKYVGKSAQVTLRCSPGGWLGVLGPVTSESTAAGNIEITSSTIENARRQLDQNTHEVNDDLDKLTASQLAHFGSELGASPLSFENSKVGKHGNFILALSANAVNQNQMVYTTDISGNQSIRFIANLPHISSCINQDNKLNQNVSTQQFIDRTTAMARRLGCLSDISLARSVTKAETIIVRKCSTGEQQSYPGRVLTRLFNHDGEYFQVMFAIEEREYKPIRIDTNVQTVASKRIAASLFSELKAYKQYEPLKSRTDKFAISTFYANTENRFKNNAFSYGGQPYLNLRAEQNSFDRGSQEYEWWAYYWWNKFGRVNGMRGNWDEGKQAWEKPGISIEHHDLSQYSAYDAGPQGGESKHLEVRFYSDMEKSNMALIFAHGGTVKNRFQIGQRADTWIIPNNTDYKYGTGNLRHLFFHGCGMVLSEFLSGKYANGIQSVCGYNGVAEELDRDGWRYSNLTAVGNPISVAWLCATISESPNNNPITVWYGKTIQDAMQGYADGSYTTSRCGSNIAIGGIWNDR